MRNIKAVGFDLDNTLYVQTQEMQAAITSYIAMKAGELLNIPKEIALRDYNRDFNELQSGRGSLMQMGLNEELANSIVQEALENAHILKCLKRDSRLVSMLKDIERKYNLFLITTSTENMAVDKLKALGISSEIFDPRLYRNLQYLRDDGSAFDYVARYLDLSLNELMFVGDREKVDILPAKKLGVITAIVNATSKYADYQLKEIYDLEKILLT